MSTADSPRAADTRAAATTKRSAANVSRPSPMTSMRTEKNIGADCTGPGTGADTLRGP